MITLEIEHLLLLNGFLFLMMGLLFTPFYIVGGLSCLASYSVDLIKRIPEDIELGDLPNNLKKQID